VFDGWSRQSPFIAGLRLQERTAVGVPDRTATLGAALLLAAGRERRRGPRRAETTTTAARHASSTEPKRDRSQGRETP